MDHAPNARSLASARKPCLCRIANARRTRQTRVRTDASRSIPQADATHTSCVTQPIKPTVHAADHALSADQSRGSARTTHRTAAMTRRSRLRHHRHLNEQAGRSASSPHDSACHRHDAHTTRQARATPQTEEPKIAHPERRNRSAPGSHANPRRPIDPPWPLPLGPHHPGSRKGPPPRATTPRPHAERESEHGIRPHEERAPHHQVPRRPRSR